jgi:hypothetical protein
MKKAKLKNLIENITLDSKIFDIHTQKSEMYMMDRNQLSEFLDIMLEYDALKDEDKEAMDWINYELEHTTTSQKILSDLTKNLIQYVYLELKCIETEHYEICAKLLKVYQVEMNDTKRLLKKYFKYTKKDCEVIDGLLDTVRTDVTKNYKIYYKILD